VLKTVKLVLQDVVVVNKILTIVLVVPVSESMNLLVNVHQVIMKKLIFHVNHVWPLV
jgi:hypothetical protein